jgi:hypothetical protein
MRRDYFTLDVDGVDGADSDRPAISIAYEGPAEQLEERLHKGDSILEADEIDVAYRLQDEIDDDPDGVLAVADRVTGEYVFELNAAAEAVFEFVDAAREFGDAGESEGRYRVVVENDGEQLATYDKSTLLVYDADGTLLRSRSLIPSGVEL